MRQTIIIDNLAFAKKHETLTGHLLPADCPRLQDPQLDATAKSNMADSIKFKLTGQSNAAKQYYLLCHIEANLTTICQRCLNEMPLKLVLDFKYLISDAKVDHALSELALDAQDFDAQDDVDFQPANQAMDVVTLIEDELIMALPIAPTHEDNCSSLVTQSGEKPNPFAVLKGLIKPEKNE
ncbi:MAG: YceD family protein [Methylophilaceae bacterium]